MKEFGFTAGMLKGSLAKGKNAPISGLRADGVKRRA
jgi:hypothetical protein